MTYPLTVEETLQAELNGFLTNIKMIDGKPYNIQVGAFKRGDEYFTELRWYRIKGFKARKFLNKIEN